VACRAQRQPGHVQCRFRGIGPELALRGIPRPPEKLERTLRDLHARGVLGFNVTVPHKQAILPHLDSILPEARAVGAVNTVTALADPTPIWQGPTRTSWVSSAIC
jgi:shikimate dehydrogenase